MKGADTLLFRCSSLDALMTEPRDKSPQQKLREARTILELKLGTYSALSNKETATAKKKLGAIENCRNKISALEFDQDKIHLSKTCRAELARIIAYEKYGYVREMETMAMAKGTGCEQDGLSLLSEVKNTLYLKNEKRLNNLYLSGVPDTFEGEDIEHAEEIIDTKLCWDLDTFLAKTADDLNEDYYYQIQGYCALTGAKRGRVAYCLVDTPEQMIQDLTRRMLWKAGAIDDSLPEWQPLISQFQDQMRYSKYIRANERVIEVVIDRDDDVIEQIYSRATQWRKYLNARYF